MPSGCVLAREWPTADRWSAGFLQQIGDERMVRLRFPFPGLGESIAGGPAFSFGSPVERYRKSYDAIQVESGTATQLNSTQRWTMGRSYLSYEWRDYARAQG